MVYHHPCDPQTGKLTPPREPVPEPEEMTLEEELALAEARLTSMGVPAEVISQGLELIRQRRGGE